MTLLTSVANPLTHKRYVLKRPLGTHWKAISCREAGCSHYEHGWETILSPRQLREIDYIRNRCGRHFTEKMEDGVITFSFPPGQKCFRQHRIPYTEMPAISLISNRQGQLNKVEWNRFTDDFNENSYRINKLRKEGF